MYCKRDFSCDDENIKKEKMKFCYIKGPTGPKGTQGDINPQGLTGVSVCDQIFDNYSAVKAWKFTRSCCSTKWERAIF